MQKKNSLMKESKNFIKTAGSTWEHFFVVYFYQRNINNNCEMDGKV
jgi:hypothetical protein